MAILGENPTTVGAALGASMMGQSLLEQTQDGENAVAYIVGDYQVTVGFFNDVARYVAFAKTSGESFADGDVIAVLSMIAPWAAWTKTSDAMSASKAGTIGTMGSLTEYEFVKKDSVGNVVLEFDGWHRTTKGYVFVYYSGINPAIAPVEAQLDAKFASSAD